MWQTPKCLLLFCVIFLGSRNSHCHVRFTKFAGVSRNVLTDNSFEVKPDWVGLGLGWMSIFKQLWYFYYLLYPKSNIFYHHSSFPLVSKHQKNALCLKSCIILLCTIADAIDMAFLDKLGDFLFCLAIFIGVFLLDRIQWNLPKGCILVTKAPKERNDAPLLIPY